MHELGPLEMEVVGLLGEAPLSVASIQEKLKKGGRDLAYTTVMTVLVRLYEKGVLSREKEGRQFLYSHAKGTSRLGERVLSKIRKSLFRNERLKPILALLEDDHELTGEELRALRKAVDERIKKSESTRG